eukprot:Clim_evm112s157 gene=Clim_evmTU112s157
MENSAAQRTERITQHLAPTFGMKRGEGKVFKKGVSFGDTDGTGLKVGIVHARWNKEIIDALVAGARKSLEAAGVRMIQTVEVSGSFEIPYAAKALIEKGDYDAIICIGCLIKGSTMHFEYICEAVSQGIMRLGLESGVPCIFGILTCLTEEQALERAGLTANGHNHGDDWGTAAVEMAMIKKANRL